MFEPHTLAFVSWHLTLALHEFLLAFSVVNSLDSLLASPSVSTKCHLDFESEKDLQIHIKKRGKSVKLHTCQRCYFVSCTKVDFDIHIKKASCSRVDSKLQLEKSHLKESITNDKKNSQDKENIDDIKDFIDKTNPKKKDENNKKTVENFKKTSNKVSKIKAVFREKRTFCLKSNFWK